MSTPAGRHAAYETDPTPYLAFMAIAGGLFISAPAVVGGIALARAARRATAFFVALAAAGLVWTLLSWDRIATEMHRAQRAGQRHGMLVHASESWHAAWPHVREWWLLAAPLGFALALGITAFRRRTIEELRERDERRADRQRRRRERGARRGVGLREASPRHDPAFELGRQVRGDQVLPVIRRRVRMPLARSAGRCSIYEHHGAWYGRWRPSPGAPQLKRKLGPKRTRGGSDGLTRSEAEARLRELMAIEATSTAAGARHAGAYTVAQLGELYVEHARKLGRKESTLTDYAMAVRVHLAPFFGDTPIRRISATQIESLILELQRDGLRPKSVRNYVGTLSTLLNFAIRREWLASTPMTAVDLPALTAGDELDEPLRFLLPLEVHALADAALPGLYQAIDRALYLTAAFTGLRQGELRGLLWQHVDFDASRVRAFENLVRGTRTTPKSRRGRSVPMARTVAHALLVVRADSNWIRPHDPVFADPVTGRPIARTPMMRRYRAALTAAGLDPAFRFHDLRHTFGTSIARAGEPVTTIQAWLGHSDLKTTQRYMHYAPAADEAERVERGSPFRPRTCDGRQAVPRRRQRRSLPSVGHEPVVGSAGCGS